MMSRNEMLAHRVSLIPTLTWYALDERYRRSRLALLLTIAEPVGVIVIFSVSRGLFLDIPPPFGTSNALFFATGVLPYYLFYHTSIRFRDFEEKRLLPRVTKFDIAVSFIIGEFLTKIVVMIVVFGSMRIYGIPDALPYSPIALLPPLLAVLTLGVAFGMTNVVINSFFAGWIYVYAPVARTMMAFSGVFGVADRMPLAFRRIVIYNPFSHCIIWFRKGFYYQYPSSLLDLRYLIVSCAIAIIFAIFLFIVTRKIREVA